jgi:ABC-type multidrug transport system ATPase subunit
MIGVHRSGDAKIHPGADVRADGRRQSVRMNESAVVTVRGLRKRYGPRWVVDGLDLDVEAGQVLGLIGANGAGKTTTVECIQGLRRPDASTLRVFGLDPVVQAERLRPMVGSQLQESALPDRLRVGEAVTLFAGGGDRDGERLLEQFGLLERRRTAFASLSGGERQRLFLVLALLGRPRLVILDELTQGLDPAARRSVWSAVDQLRRDGTTMLLVTHELDEAEALCDRVVAMRAGRILDAGAPVGADRPPWPYVSDPLVPSRGGVERVAGRAGSPRRRRGRRAHRAPRGGARGPRRDRPRGRGARARGRRP